jgi:uncharacterized PurR-regulated membrane protein YhhQ (DUF165 family)
MVVLYVALYLAAIIAANLIVTWLGPGASPYTAFALIGATLTIKDSLQDKWTRNGLVWRMSLLIAAGSFLSWLINRKSGRIALASFVAFAISTTVDVVIYALLSRHSRWRRVGWSNAFGAIADSVVFPALAFGWPPDPIIVYQQIVAKGFGGQIWSLILTRSGPDIKKPKPKKPTH